LEELLDYLKAKETPATVQLLSTNSLTTLEKGMEAVTLTRKGVFFQNLAQLGDLLKLTEAERDVLLFVCYSGRSPASGKLSMNSIAVGSKNFMTTWLEF
jgi:hypothetical protein